MRAKLLKAKARKIKYLKRKEQIEDDSDEYLSSDDEEEVSENIIGSLINNKYIILKYLGKGTFSEVWLVYDIINHNYYALKVQINKDDSEEFINEIKFLNLLKKNKAKDVVNIIDSFEIFFKGIRCYAILLELLGDNIGNINLNNIGNIKKLLYNILKGIREIHNLNLIHCDLKMDNILLTKYNNNIKIFIENFENKFDINTEFLNLYSESVKLIPLGDNKNKKKNIKKKIKKKIVRELKKKYKRDIIEFSQKYLNSLDDNNDTDIFNVKILDLSNCEEDNGIKDSEIYIRTYRPPENILNDIYTRKSDIWVIGCIFYELITDKEIFEFPHNLNSDDKDRLHIFEITNLLGNLPKHIINNCKNYNYFFDNKGRIINNKKNNLRELMSEIKENYDIELLETLIITDLIKKMLTLDPENRQSADELLNHNWFQDL